MVNTSIDLARHAEEAVHPLMARYDEIFSQVNCKGLQHLFHKGTANNIYSSLYYFARVGSLWDLNAGCSTTEAPGHRDLHRREKADTARCLDFWFMQSFQFLEELHYEADSATQPRREALKSDYKPRGACGFTGDEYEIAIQDFVELTLLGYHAPILPSCFEDEVSHAMGVIREQPGFRLWTVFAWQLFRDAQELLHPHQTSQAFDELQEFLEAAEVLLKDIIDDAAERVHPSEYSKGADEMVQGVLARIRFMRVDWVERVGNSYEGNLTVSTSTQNKPFRLLRRHPLFCGFAL